MKDFSKLILAGGFLSILFVYGGVGDHGSKADQVAGHQTVSNVQRDSPVAQTPEVAPGRTAQKSVSPISKISKVSRKPPTLIRFVVYFDFDSARISSRSKRTIQQALAFAKSVEAKTVGLAGFADSAGPANYNMKLSQRRAHVVAALKTLDTGLQDLDVKAFGEKRLAVDTPDGLAELRNRRVEIIITA